MSKYTEAEVLNAIKTMGLFRTPYPKEIVENVVHNALEKTDRLEQMWEEVKDKEFPHSIFPDCRYCWDYMKGVKDTLADIRGDAE